VDVRERIVRSVRRGEARQAVAETFEVSLGSVER
jgi:hypothetical protein